MRRNEEQQRESNEERNSTSKGRLKVKWRLINEGLVWRGGVTSGSCLLKKSNQRVMNNNDLSLTENNGKAACRAPPGQGLADDGVFGQRAFTTHTHTRIHMRDVLTSASCA